jgi:hypothetical protein
MYFVNTGESPSSIYLETIVAAEVFLLMHRNHAVGL